MRVRFLLLATHLVAFSCAGEPVSTVDAGDDAAQLDAGDAGDAPACAPFPSLDTFCSSPWTRPADAPARVNEGGCLTFDPSAACAAQRCSAGAEPAGACELRVYDRSDSGMTDGDVWCCRR